MVTAYTYPFLNIFWTMLIFFAWVCWITILFMVLADNFRRPDHSGWAKAGWAIVILIIPLFGTLIYLIARPAVVDVAVM